MALTNITFEKKVVIDYVKFCQNTFQDYHIKSTYIVNQNMKAFGLTIPNLKLSTYAVCHIQAKVMS